MAGNRVNEAELATSLSEVMDRVLGGERIAIERDGEVVAAIIPRSEDKTITWGEFVATYFDRPRPDEKFADDLEAVQAAQGVIANDSPIDGKPTLTWGEFLDAYFTWPRPDDRLADDLEAVLADRPVKSGAPEWPD